MKLKLTDNYIYINGEKHVLPYSYTLEERKALCEELIAAYPDHFTYSLPVSKNDEHGNNVEKLLDMLGQYLLNAIDVSKKDGVITEWSERMIRENEINFCEINDEYEEFS
ncbi:hypothetical protein [Eubacterium limosum]|uniref:hypothetical protein n=1 Tax=Eubacterium limosum TaxID=1736 RepID=UPI001062DAB9|nr:hypothetical protein [Eubacterium limosum]